MNAMAVFLFAFVLIGVLPLLFRSKGASVFMMLCVGRALMEIASDDVADFAKKILNSSLPIEDITKIFVMLLPAFLTLLVTKKAAKKKYPYHIIPSIVGGLLAGFWSVSLLTSVDSFAESTTFKYVQSNNSVILLIGILSTLFLLMMERPKPVKPEDAGKEHGK